MIGTSRGSFTKQMKPIDLRTIATAKATFNKPTLDQSDEHIGIKVAGIAPMTATNSSRGASTMKIQHHQKLAARKNTASLVAANSGAIQGFNDTMSKPARNSTSKPTIPVAPSTRHLL